MMVDNKAEIKEAQGNHAEMRPEEKKMEHAGMRPEEEAMETIEIRNVK